MYYPLEKQSIAATVSYRVMAPISPFAFPLHPRQYAPKPFPSLKEWQHLWSAWDMVTTEMIPGEALLEKPIPLRNPLIFYLGHIPTL